MPPRANNLRALFQQPAQERERGPMDFAIDLSDASQALDLVNIRFQLMYACPPIYLGSYSLVLA